MFGPHLHQDTRGTRVRLLSSRRRHPAAKALLLVFGLFMMGALYSRDRSPGSGVGRYREQPADRGG